MIVSKGLTDSLGTAIDDHDVRSLVHDWDVDGPDWRAYPKPERDNEHYVQPEGGHRFHGDRARFTRHVGKKTASRLLDGREWNELPRLPESYEDTCLIEPICGFFILSSSVLIDRGSVV
jgi:hypothetical protein